MRPYVIAPVTVNQEQIKEMMRIACLREVDYDTTDPYFVADIIESFIERLIEVHYA